MIVGSLAVLAALVLLLRAITSTAPAAPVTQAPAARPTSSQTTTVGPAPSPSAPATRTPAPLPQARPRAEDSRPSQPNLAPIETANDDAPPGTMLNTKGLHFGLPHLREKITANAPHVIACIGSSKPTGDATLTFIVAQRADKFIIEQSDADHEASTIKDEKLLECLTTASAKIQIDGLPREATAIYVTRILSLKDGAIADDKPLKFSYIR